MKLFRELTNNEETKFRQWARANYVAWSPISGLWHPVIQDECQLINKEADLPDYLRPLADDLVNE